MYTNKNDSWNLEKCKLKELCNHFVWIASIGQTMWVHTSPRFMTNLEIIIEKNKKTTFFCPLWRFRITYQQSTILMKIWHTKWKENKRIFIKFYIQICIEDEGIEILGKRSLSRQLAIRKSIVDVAFWTTLK